MNEEYFHSQVFKIFSDFPYRLTHTVVNRQFFQEMKKGENEFRIRCSFNANKSLFFYKSSSIFDATSRCNNPEKISNNQTI